jgi:hypothetical protein
MKEKMTTTTYSGKTFLKVADAITYLNAGGFTGIDAIFYCDGKGITIITHVTA